MQRTWLRFLAALFAFGLFAAACGSDRDDSASTDGDTGGEETGGDTDGDTGDTGGDDDGDTGETGGDDDGDTGGDDDGDAGDTAGDAGEAPDGETFGDLPVPCGPTPEGMELTDSDVGVTAESIQIGSVDDRGFVDAPGINHEMTDAMTGLVAYCNELGGINGRQIELENYDAALFNATNVAIDACEAGDFMLVGNGMSFDQLAEQTRLGCGLAQIPAWTVSAAAAHAPLSVVAVPNPSDQLPISIAVQLAELFPESIGNTGILFGNFSATIETKDKVLAAYPDVGWEFGPQLEYNISGEDDWTPFVTQLADANVTHVYFTGGCLPNFLAYMQTANLNGFDVPHHGDANFYEAVCAESNTDGVMDNMHVRMVFLPFEEADIAPAVQDYVDIVTEYSSGDISLLGMQTTSSFWLWAQSAAECGADLTRDCVLENAAAVTGWTGGGLHVPTNPGDNDAPNCGLIMKLNGTTYERVVPAEPGTFACDDSWNPTITVPALEAALLDENRISQQYTG